MKFGIDNFWFLVDLTDFQANFQWEDYLLLFAVKIWTSFKEFTEKIRREK